MLQSSSGKYPAAMTWTSLRNDAPEPIEPGPVAPSTETYEVLRRRARALRHDNTFLALLRRPGTSQSDALRLALDAVPALELLPLPVVAEELGAVLNSARTLGGTTVTRVWLV